MDDSILAKFPDDDRVLGPFLGNLLPEILDVVVQKLGWFQTTFAMAGRTCREAVERVPSARPALTERERDLSRLPGTTTPLAVAVVEGDVEAVEWLIRRREGRGVARPRPRAGALSVSRTPRRDRAPEALRAASGRGTRGRATTRAPGALLAAAAAARERGPHGTRPPLRAICKRRSGGQLEAVAVAHRERPARGRGSVGERRRDGGPPGGFALEPVAQE